MSIINSVWTLKDNKTSSKKTNPHNNPTHTPTNNPTTTVVAKQQTEAMWHV
jgi:hypothetical protein